MKQNDTTVRFDEKLLTAYFAGAATPDEERMLWEWICASDENRRVFAELRAVWQRGRMQRPDTQLPARFVRSLNGLNRRIDALDAAPVWQTEGGQVYISLSFPHNNCTASESKEWEGRYTR